MDGGVAVVPPAPAEAPRISVLGIPISRVDYQQAVETIMAWASRRESRAVSAMAVHGVMTGVLDREHGKRLNQFDMLTPDGQPVRWAMNWLGNAGLRERVYGPDLTKFVCAAAAEAGIGVYLYGSRPDVVQRMAERLQNWFPRLRIVGIQPSRFRPATSDEDRADIEQINGAEPGIVLVGLGCPRQEVWAYDHLGRVEAVMMCVGAAFDFHAGLMPQAPKWMQRRGLEWAFRFLQEPRRLWKRYLLLNPLYLLLVLAQGLGLWHSDLPISQSHR